MRVLLQEAIVPYMAQVALLDPAGKDYPIPELGDEVFTTRQVVAVATRSDYVDGDLRELPVELWIETDASGDVPPGTAVFVGEIEVSGSEIALSDCLGDVMYPVAVQPGTYSVRVFREPESRPAEVVRFLLGGPRS